MSRALLSQKGQKAEFIKDTILKQWLNISDFSQLDIDTLVRANVSTDVEYYLGHMISDRALLGWSTHGVSILY
jgi:alkaline phosphatase